MKERIGFIDTAKMIGIYLMIIGHCNMVDSIPYLSKFIYLFHMPLFFIISGYLYKPVELSLSIKKYSAAYLLPYLIMTVSSIVVVVPCSLYLGMDVIEEIKILLVAIVCGSGNFGGMYPAIGVGWFLCALFIAMFFYNLISNYYNYSNKTIVIFTIFVLTWASCLKITLPFSIQAGLSSMLFLLIGEGLRKFNLLENNITNIKLVTPFVGMIIILAILYGRISVARCIYEMPIISLPACVLLCYSVLLISRKFNMGGGEYTLLIMAGNQIVSYANYRYNMGNILLNLTSIQILNFIIELLIDFFITLLLACCFSFIPWMSKQRIALSAFKFNRIPQKK